MLGCVHRDHDTIRSGCAAASSMQTWALDILIKRTSFVLGEKLGGYLLLGRLLGVGLVSSIVLRLRGVVDHVTLNRGFFFNGGVIVLIRATHP